VATSADQDPSVVALGESASTTVDLLGLSGTPVRASASTVGTGRPVVFLHGLVGLNEHWEDVVSRVRHRMRCVLLELPLLALEGEDCSIDGVMALTIRFLREHVGEPAVLAGNSFGGHVALRVALQEPGLVGGLVLAGSSGLIERSMVSDIQIRPSREWLERKIGELFYDRERNMRVADVDRAWRELGKSRRGARAMVKLSRSARRNHLGSRIGNIAAPSLLVWGRNDVVTPPEAAEEFMNLLPDARLVWLDRCGHAPMIEQPEAFARALTDFIAELDRRDAPDQR
jgi:2-hydroxy-6-oxonona-2,4-dienedioate hydrolase